MANLFRLSTFFICASFLFCQIPVQAFAKYYTANQAPTRITENAPRILAPPELPIPVKPVEKIVEKIEKKSAKKDSGFNKKWLWGIAGGAVLIGIIAAVAGGGSSGGGGGDDDDDTGSITVAW